MMLLLIYLFAIAFVSTITFIFLRYGPVHHSWMNIPKKYQNILKCAHRDYWNEKSTTNNERGKSLYKKRLISQNGLAIYANGIFGKFCMGPDGRYLFIPFTMISHIYNIIIKNPFIRSGNWLFAKKWSGLQIETIDYHVLVVDSRYHNHDKIIDILTKLLGNSWESIYSVNHDINETLFNGTYGWHTHIRTMAMSENLKKT